MLNYFWLVAHACKIVIEINNNLSKPILTTAKLDDSIVTDD